MACGGGGEWEGLDGLDDSGKDTGDGGRDGGGGGGGGPRLTRVTGPGVDGGGSRLTYVVRAARNITPLTFSMGEMP